ncbi:hypothetical protein AB0J38_25305 [Streptomyces sp. NPDC050095]|uniref:hypothetical protein n=1 Tax=unclassified Streptomyces TaxID=2593676 RepID=UPI0034163093
MPVDIQHQTRNFVNASWLLLGLRDLIYQVVGLLFTELSEHGGMAGDDDAGRAFAHVYKPAVKAVVDCAGHAHQAMAGGANALVRVPKSF